MSKLELSVRSWKCALTLSQGYSVPLQGMLVRQKEVKFQWQRVCVCKVTCCIWSPILITTACNSLIRVCNHWSIWACRVQRSWESLCQAVIKSWFCIKLCSAIPDRFPTVTIDIRLRMPAITHPIMCFDLFKPFLSRTGRNTESVHGSVRLTGSHNSDLCLTIAILTLWCEIVWFKHVYKAYAIQLTISRKINIKVTYNKYVQEVHTRLDITCTIV